jgi:hypothetical protein
LVNRRIVVNIICAHQRVSHGKGEAGVPVKMGVGVQPREFPIAVQFGGEISGSRGTALGGLIGKHIDGKGSGRLRIDVLRIERGAAGLLANRSVLHKRGRP